MPFHLVDVAIVGAGPYGLSIASHLRRTNVTFRIFGKPMRFWLDMPSGLFLKSFGFATTIANPERLTYDGWCRERGLETCEPCSMESFAEYGLWLQRQLVPEVETEEVVGIAHTAEENGVFRLTLSGGGELQARRVVVAVGLRHFQRLPSVLAHLPASLVSHTAQQSDYRCLRGKDVCVIGAGQSALEAAALLHEAGARPRLLVRGGGPVFHTRTPLERPLIDRLRAPITVLGAGRMHWVLQHFPMLIHYVPERIRVRFTRGYLGPAGAWWLRERFEPVPVHRRCEVISARAANGGVALRVREDGAEREIRADHVVAGTGFEVDLDRLPFLSEDLRARTARVERAPRLDRHFQSSVPGLYFVGVLSMFSFGPLFRFVAGTAVSAPRVARHLVRTTERQALQDVVFSGG
jgi:cation diffusion facilitator CzcD-associated flavoprotein CzcO